MHVSAQSFWVPKAGSSFDEYEDAYWPLNFVEENGNVFKFAVADGATEASYSKIWAQILVEAYCQCSVDVFDPQKSIQQLQTKWLDSLASLTLPWYAEEKIRDGAFSSLLGVTIQESTKSKKNSRKIIATAVGDSCLFQVREDSLVLSFPITHSEQFDSRPALISSNKQHNECLRIPIAHHKWEPEDTLFLMTDALACWFLKAVEAGEKPWRIKRNNQNDFERWISGLRQKKDIRNDDVTMVRIELLKDLA